MRQRYQSDLDLARQRAIATRLAPMLGVELQSTTGMDYWWERTDYLLLDEVGKPISIMECKWRDVDEPLAFYDRWGGVVISTSKIIANQEIARHLGVPMLLAWRFPDGIFVCEYRDECTVERRMGGRTKQTRDKWDVEECDYIPSRFWTRWSASPPDPADFVATNRLTTAAG